MEDIVASSSTANTTVDPHRSHGAARLKKGGRYQGTPGMFWALVPGHIHFPWDAAALTQPAHRIFNYALHAPWPWPCPGPGHLSGARAAVLGGGWRPRGLIYVVRIRAHRCQGGLRARGEHFP